MNIVEQILEYDRQEKKREVTKQCGMWLGAIDVVTGRWKSKYFRCKNWRECDNCYEHRVQEWWTKAQALFGDSPVLSALAMSEKEARRITRKTTFIRFPLEDGTVLLLHANEDGQPLEAYQGEFHEWVNIPEDTRVSSTRIPIEKEEKTGQKVRVPQVLYEPADSDKVRKAFGRAVDMTRDLEPVDWIGVQRAVDTRMGLFFRFAAQLGVKLKELGTRYQRLNERPEWRVMPIGNPAEYLDVSRHQGLEEIAGFPSTSLHHSG